MHDDLSQSLFRVDLRDDAVCAMDHVQSRADEGMWTPDNVPKLRLGNGMASSRAMLFWSTPVGVGALQQWRLGFFCSA